LLSKPSILGTRPEIDPKKDPKTVLLCDYLARQWRETLGLEIAWTQVPRGRFHDRVSAGIPKMWLGDWWADFPDPDNFPRSHWWGCLRWAYETHDRRVEEARCVLDQTERPSMYQPADKIVVEEAPVIP
jgi:ABC-type transport system substrate-binding protein